MWGILLGTILDYLTWRGDLLFSQDSFNNIDALILSQITYIDFDGIVSDDFSKTVTLAECAHEIKRRLDEDAQAKVLVPFINTQTVDIFLRAAECNRFSSLRLAGHINVIDEKTEQQFCALTIRDDWKGVYIVFRGTDDSLIGWKEDLNMSFKSPVPSQSAAVDYVTQVSKKLSLPLILCGHSKGGNLATYAACFCNTRVKKKIRFVYNFDGPGFPHHIIESDEYKNALEIINTFIPQSSFFGVLLDRAEPHQVVESDSIGIMQHDLLSWHIIGNNFVYCNDRSDLSYFTDKTVRDWLLKLNSTEKELFVNTIYRVLEVTKAKTVSELSRSWIKHSATIIKCFYKTDETTKKVVLKVIRQLFDAAKENFLPF